MSAVPSATPDTQALLRAARLHRLRIARGACWVIVTALLGVVALALLDAAIRLPGWARGLGLAVWLTSTSVVAWRLIVQRLPLSSRDDFASHPRKELLENLRAMSAAAISLASVLFLATLVPGAADHLRRAALPWSRPSNAMVRVTVTSGEPVVRRGAPVTLTAYAEQKDSSADIPITATLFGQETDGREWKMPMIGDGSNVFHVTRPTVNADFRYRVQIGSTSSEWFTVFAMDLSEPSSDSSIVVQPPAYAPLPSVKQIPGFVSFEGIQFGTVELKLRLTRPATTAFLEWRADGEGTTELTTLDVSSGSTTIRLKQSGTLKLVTVVEQNGKTLRSEWPIRVRVIPDSPPQLERIAGVSARPRLARPGTILPIEVVASDDIAIGSAAFEYALGPDDSRVTTIPIPLSQRDSSKAEGRLDFDLSGKGQAGDAIRFRVRVADTRRLNELTPQETLYPTEGWSILRLDPLAPPLDEQDILLQRDAIGEASQSSLRQLNEVMKAIVSLKHDIGDKASLAHDHSVRLSDAGDDVKKTASFLLESSRDSALIADLLPLSSSFREVAMSPLRGAEESLRKASTDNPTERTRAFDTTVLFLRDAIVRLERINELNQRYAQARLDRKKIGLLAELQMALADATKPSGTTTTEELARKQRELLANLETVIAQSEPLRVSTREAIQLEHRQLGVRVAELAAALRELDKGMTENALDARRSLLVKLATEQGELSAQAMAIFSRIETAVRLAGVEPPNPERLTRISRLILENKTVDALTELLALAQSLEAIAATFDKWAVDRVDPKIAVRQVARWQQDLCLRFRAETSGKAIRYDKLTTAKKGALKTEQAAIVSTLRAMSLPAGNEIARTRDLAAGHLEAAAESLAGSGAHAEEAMTRAAEALNRLGEKLPTIGERLARSRGEFARIQQAQDSTLVEIDQILRGTASINKLAGLAERQRKTLLIFQSLDLPTIGARRARTINALASAAGDLKDGSILDVFASQQWVKREFERLKLILEGMASPDDRYRDFALRLQQIAKGVRALGPTATEKQLSPYLNEAKEVKTQFSQLAPPPEAASLHFEAREAFQAAEAAWNESKTPHSELVRRLQIAGECLSALSTRLNGAESEQDRVRRLASNRRLASVSKKETDPAAAGETARQLGRDMEELSLTRVGHAGQAHKKRLLEQYSRLKDQQFPDRMFGIHKNMAESLDELAALMADQQDLAARFDLSPPASPTSDADRYLPSQLHSASLRELIRQQNAIHDRKLNLPSSVQQLLKPVDASPLLEIEKKQHKLTRSIAEFVKAFDGNLAGRAHNAATYASRVSVALANGAIPSALALAEQTAQELQQMPNQKGVQLAEEQKSIRAEIGNLATQQYGLVTARQVIRGEELAQRASTLAKEIELAAQNCEPSDPAASSLREVARMVMNAEKQIADVARRTSEGLHNDADKSRQAATETLEMCTKRVATLAPSVESARPVDLAATAAATALLRSKGMMHQALVELGGKVDRPAIEKTMRSSGMLLREAEQMRAKVFPIGD